MLIMVLKRNKFKFLVSVSWENGSGRRREHLWLRLRVIRKMENTILMVNPVRRMMKELYSGYATGAKRMRIILPSIRRIRVG